VLVTNV